MAEVKTQEFLTLSTVRDSLAITETNDDRLLPIINSANRQITLALVPVLDNRDLEGTTYWNDASNLALLYFQSVYERRINHAHEEAEAYHREYMASMKFLVAAIKAEPENSKRTVVAYAGAEIQSPLLRNIPNLTDRYGRFLDREI